jgi:catechol 2,3-dioxygenase-like lactoylglutathione lyase family enzyme
MITGINHITLAVTDVERAFAFYRDVLGFKPLCKWEGCAYFLVGHGDNPLWLCLDRDVNHQAMTGSTHYAFSLSKDDFESMTKRIVESGAHVYKNNTSPGESLYFLDPDNHKLEIHVGNWQAHIESKKANPGKWTTIEWFV